MVPRPAVVVVGSLNMDFVVQVDHLPTPGETVLGYSFQTIPGGKGANQAFAAGRLGSGTVDVRMAGRVGRDVFADQLKASLTAAGVDVTAVEASSNLPTGVALIWVDSVGQNSIVVASGANHDFPAAEVESLRSVFRGARLALFQLETPLATVEAALLLARSEGLVTILDPAPAQILPPSLLRAVDVLTPNESEALILLGRPAARLSMAEAPSLAAALRERGPRTVILKLGDQGCLVDDEEGSRHFPAFSVEVRDTTAAGDTFNAALAVALAEGASMDQSVALANAAAAISVSRVGAQTSAPTRAEVEDLLRGGSPRASF
ncbi:MAG: ribokinase [Bryobacteraceae bacterium]